MNDAHLFERFACPIMIHSHRSEKKRKKRKDKIKQTIINLTGRK
jgi:hypothetical protein